ncbi:MAG TPA: zf-HC2 domain-containing protein, partial [Candidatus Binatia bacterium]
GPWLDGELRPAQAADLKFHVEGCASCAEEKARLERLEFALKRTLETRAAQVAFEPFWAGVSRRIAQDKQDKQDKTERSWRGRALEWAQGWMAPPRLAWAVPAAIVLILGLFSLQQYFPGPTNQAAVESIDGHGFNVALLREAKTKTTVIWLFDNQESENEASADSASTDTAF